MSTARTARVIKPPAPIDLSPAARSVFLAGSIDMGRAEDWQSTLTNALADRDVAILNPRRDEWDASWEQDTGFAPFREQVEWELAGLERATVIAMYFAPTSQAPVTLLELGLFARSGARYRGRERALERDVACGSRHSAELARGARRPRATMIDQRT